MAEGLAIDGPMYGETMERVPTYHMTWSEWKELHPDTLVLKQPEDPFHRDQRGGHGDEEWFQRPGISPAFVRTLGENPDVRLSENVNVLSVTHDAQTRIYSIEEVRRIGGVANDVLAGEPIVVWSGPKLTSFGMAAHYRELDGQVLTFQRTDSGFRDQESGTLWDVEGRAISGPKAGKQLTNAVFSFIRWHGWAWAHKENDIFESSERSAEIDEGMFKSLLDVLRQASYRIEVTEALVSLQLPNEATNGMVVRVNHDRFKLLAFATRTAAEDYAYGYPHSLRLGKLVLQSDPEEHLQYEDSIHSRLLPDERIPWSRLINEMDFAGRSFVDLVRKTVPEVEKEKEIGLTELLVALKDQGYEVEIGVDFVIEGIRTRRWLTETPRSQLRVGGLNCIYASINGSRFLVHKFASEALAQAYLDNEERHAFRVRQYVLRNAPDDMYYNRAGFGQKPDDEVSWSTLLSSEDFVLAVSSIIETT